jgi:hypothetical protein
MLILMTIKALTEAEGKSLLAIIEATVVRYVKMGSRPMVEVDREAEPGLLEKRGCFVTLHKDGKLRGCVGLFETDEPLYKTVIEMSISAATKDSRFSPVFESELSALSYEVSVLTPMRRIVDTNDIEIGRDGIFIVKDGHRGVLLPQVATEHGFDRERFLDETCLKAGLREGDWKEDAEIYIFQSEIFSRDGEYVGTTDQSDLYERGKNF